MLITTIIAVPIVIIIIGNVIRNVVLNIVVAGPLAAWVAVAAGKVISPTVIESRWMIAISIMFLLAYLEYARRYPRIDVAGSLAQWRESGQRRSQVRRSLKRRYVAELERV